MQKNAWLTFTNMINSQISSLKTWHHFNFHEISSPATIKQGAVRSVANEPGLGPINFNSYVLVTFCYLNSIGVGGVKIRRKA